MGGPIRNRGGFDVAGFAGWRGSGKRATRIGKPDRLLITFEQAKDRFELAELWVMAQHSFKPVSFCESSFQKSWG